MLHHWLRMPDFKAIRIKSDKQEDRLAKMLGGLVNPGSGSGWRKRQDVRSPGYLWEMKRTDNIKSISIRVDALEQLRKHALLDDRIPAMHIEIGNRKYVLLHEDDFLEISGLEDIDG
jgi:hypothetical protein